MHPLDRSIASDLSYECLKRQRRESEITRTHADQGAGLTHLSRPIPVIKFWDAGEGEIVLDPIVRSLSEREETAIWYRHRGKK